MVRVESLEPGKEGKQKSRLVRLLLGPGLGASFFDMFAPWGCFTHILGVQNLDFSWALGVQGHVLFNDSPNGGHLIPDFGSRLVGETTRSRLEEPGMWLSFAKAFFSGSQHESLRRIGR